MSAGMKEGLSNSRPPLLEGMNYLIWKTKMRSFLCSLDDDVWFSILEGYKIPAEVTEQGSIPKSRSKWTVQEKRDSNMNSKALNALFCGVDDLNFRYIQNCKIAKEAWDKLEVAHEGTDGVKRSKLQMLTSQFESIRMEEGEKIADFNAKLIDITNRSCLLGEEYIESKIVRKILRSLPHRFQGKVIAIEESKNVDKIRLEELIGSLETFEMSLGEDKKEKVKNIAFKTENNPENNEAIDNEELGLGFDENKVCSNSSTIFVKATSSSLNSEIVSQANKESKNIISRPRASKKLHLKKNVGCTKHMTGDIRNFYSLDDFGTGTIVYGNGEISNILGVGQVDITGLPSMDKVCYVDKLAVNLISIGQLCDSGFKVLFDEYYCNIYDSNKKIVGQGYRTARGLYRAKIIEFDICTNESLSDIDENEDDCDRANESQEGNEVNEQ
ncbi:hypothetical protein UlMin_042445 [Ulmus minor]